MKVSLEKKYFFSSIIVLTLSSCGWILEDHRYDYLKERQSEPIKSSSEESTRPIVDYYPIPNTTENLVGFLERRLDTVTYRAKFAITVFSARQLINHGHIRINGKKVNIPSYLVKEEDAIEIKDKSKEITMIAGALVSKEREVPDYIQMDEKNKKAKLIRVPKFSEVPYPTIMEPNLVIEYYSR